MKTEKRPLHTPGPWETSGPNKNCVYGVEPEYNPDGSDRRLLVAYCNSTGEVPPKIDEANARLVAAAPDLLESLTSLLAEHHLVHSADCPAGVGTEKYDPTRCNRCAVERARQAIIKAEMHE